MKIIYFLVLLTFSNNIVAKEVKTYEGGWERLCERPNDYHWNYNKPKDWSCLKRMAVMGVANDQRRVGWILLHGKTEVEPKNIEEGLFWLNKAASQNDTLSQRFLSLIYNKDQEVPQNLELSYQWSYLADLNSNRDTEQLVSEPLKALTPQKREQLKKDAFKLLFKNSNPLLGYNEPIKYAFLSEKDKKALQCFVKE